MQSTVSRRHFMAAAATASVVTMPQITKASAGKRLIHGISGSPRKGQTTAVAVQEALEAASKVDTKIETELIDLGGLEIAGSAGASRSDLAE